MIYKLHTFFLSISALCFLHLSAQQVQLKGVVTVQNSKTNTGKTQFVKNAEVSHINLQNATTKDVTGDDGKFQLNIKGVVPNTQTKIAVIPHGEYSDYVVVNEKELKDITLGRVTPVSVFVCKKGELEQRQAEMVGINMRKLEERLEIDKKRLQKELDEIRAKNDYLNVRYSEIKDSLDIISKNMDRAFERIKEYAKTMILENLDDRDANYIKAYNCFSRGVLDSVSFYLQEHELDLKYQKIIQIQKETQQKKELIDLLTESIKKEEEFTENSINELIKQWLLLARTADMQNDFERAVANYEKVIRADSTNIENIYEYGYYLQKNRAFSQAQQIYLQCLEIKKLREEENLNIDLVLLGKIINNLALTHFEMNDYPKAFEGYREALEIRKKIAQENSEYYTDVVRTLNNLANVHNILSEFQNAIPIYNEALTICRTYLSTHPKEYKYLLANVLNNLSLLHRASSKYSEAIAENEEALTIFRNLDATYPKEYRASLANSLSNMAILYSVTNDNYNALRETEHALHIFNELANENPKANLFYVARTLSNLAYYFYLSENYENSLEEYEKALKIYRELAVENPKTYLIYFAHALNGIGNLHRDHFMFSEALRNYEEALVIRKKVAEEYSTKFILNVLETMNNISMCYMLAKDYSRAELYARQALEIDPEYSPAELKLAHALLMQNRYVEAETIYIKLLSEENNAPIKSIIKTDFEQFEKASSIPQERNADVERIKSLLEK